MNTSKRKKLHGKKTFSADTEAIIDGLETMTEEEANELAFGDFADEISLYGLDDIGNK